LKIWIKLLIGIIAGLFIGVFMPEYFDYMRPFVAFLSETAVNLLLYLTVPFIFVKMFTGFISMKNTKVKIWKVTSVFILTIISSLVLSIIISMFIMNISVLQPDSGIDLFQRSAVKLELLTFSDIISNIFSGNPFYFFVKPLKFILPVIFLSIVLAYGTLSSGKKGNSFYDVMKSLGDILDKIVVQLVEVFSVMSFFIVATATASSKNDFILTPFAKPFIAILIAAFVLFVILMLLLRFIFKEDQFHYYIGLLGAALTGFVTGHAGTTIIPLNLHLKRNLNIDDDSVDYLVPLGIALNNTGTVIVATIVLMSIITGIAPSTLTIKLQIMIFLYMLLYSFRLDGVHEMGFVVLLGMLLKDQAFTFENNSYLIFLGAVPLFSRLALFINTFTTGVFVMITGNYMGGQQKVEYRDFI
jgi:Na+/H+-dicarboxylate symporter